MSDYNSERKKSISLITGEQRTVLAQVLAEGWRLLPDSE